LCGQQQFSEARRFLNVFNPVRILIFFSLQFDADIKGTFDVHLDSLAQKWPDLSAQLVIEIQKNQNRDAAVKKYLKLLNNKIENSTQIVGLLLLPFQLPAKLMKKKVGNKYSKVESQEGFIQHFDVRFFPHICIRVHSIINESFFLDVGRVSVGDGQVMATENRHTTVHGNNRER
jgi:hypothetical protein